jgi:hypothetical protein
MNFPGYNPSPVMLAGLTYLMVLWPIVQLASCLEHKLGV